MFDVYTELCVGFEDQNPKDLIVIVFWQKEEKREGGNLMHLGLQMFWSALQQ